MNTFDISLLCVVIAIVFFFAGALLVYFNYAKIVKQVQRTVAEITPVVKKVEADVKSVEATAGTVVADVKKL